MNRKKAGKFFILTFDLEKFVRPVEKNLDYNEDELFEVSKQGLDRIMEILRRHGIKSTFFVTYDFAKKYSKMIKKLSSEGHEIALHAYNHSDNYLHSDKEDTYDKLKKAKRYLEKISGKNIKGFRSPQCRILDFNILEKLGISYDSSLHPTYVPGKYFHLFSRRRPFYDGKILEIPVSVAAFFRLPFSWLWFRNFGLFYEKACTRLNLLNSDYVNLYFHPWDFADLEKYEGIIEGWYLRNTGKKFASMIEKYIKYCKKMGLYSVTISDYIKSEI